MFFYITPVNAMDIDDIVNRYWKRIKAHYGVLSVRRGTEFVHGKDTGIPCITVFVDEKKPLAKLTPDQILPDEIEGVHIDVIELSSPDYVIGETDVSKLDPDSQRRIASGVKKGEEKHGGC
jgi:hypothetical protein